MEDHRLLTCTGMITFYDLHNQFKMFGAFCVTKTVVNLILRPQCCSLSNALETLNLDTPSPFTEIKKF